MLHNNNVSYLGQPANVVSQWPALSDKQIVKPIISTIWQRWESFAALVWRNLVLAGVKSNFQAVLHSDIMHFSVIGFFICLAAVGVLSEREPLKSHPSLPEKVPSLRSRFGEET